MTLRLFAVLALLPLSIARADPSTPTPVAPTPPPAKVEGASSVIVIHPDQPSVHPSMAADAKGALHVVYEATEPGKLTQDIFYTTSLDGGKTWSSGIDISSTPGISSDPCIATHGDELIVVWVDTSSGDERPDVFSTRSLDGGKTWSKAVDVSQTSGKSSQPAVTFAPDGTVHAVWIDSTEGKLATAEKKVKTVAAHMVGKEPAPAKEHPDVWWNRSTDGGVSWGKPLNITSTPGVSSDPRVACGPKGEVYVTWADTSNGEVNRDIWFIRSANGGKRWAKPFDVSKTPGLSSSPGLAVDGSGTVFVGWDDTSVGESHPDVFVKASHDGGKTFDPYVDVSPTPGISSDVAIHATADGHVAVVWTDTTLKTQAPDVWLAVSADDGKTYAPPRDLSNTPGVSDWAHVVVVNGTAFVLWEEDEHAKSLLKLASAPMK